MVTFGEIYRDVCQQDYALCYEGVQQHLRADYVSQPGNPSRIEILWPDSKLAIPQLLRNEIFNASIEIFADVTREDIKVARALAVIGDTAVCSEVYEPEAILKILTDGDCGLNLVPFQHSTTRTETIG